MDTTAETRTTQRKVKQWSRKPSPTMAGAVRKVEERLSLVCARTRPGRTQELLKAAWWCLDAILSQDQGSVERAVHLLQRRQV